MSENPREGEVQPERDSVVVSKLDQVPEHRESSDKKIDEKKKTMAAAREMTENVSKYVSGQFDEAIEEYAFLKKLNDLSTEQYQELSGSASELFRQMEGIRQKFDEFAPYVRQIKLIEESLLRLEGSVNVLEEYTRAVESRFKRRNKG